ncbi:MAG: ABC transporter substrate-binding protein [Tannerellaceae bacterium]|nr:ABC transporter substrate-binding protein [Tannerellaceae bacterium]
MYKFLGFLFIFLYTGCISPATHKDPTFRVAVLRGPSAIAFAGWLEQPPVIDGMPVSLKIIDSPEQIQALLVKGEADLAALPMNTAANLYNKGLPYYLLGCPVWGTLYIVGKGTLAAREQPVIHLFGTGTAPDILTRYYLENHPGDYKLNYSLGTAREVMAGLLTGKVEYAVLSEPFVSMALSRDTTLHILADLNRFIDGQTAFPQTALVYSGNMSHLKDTLIPLLTDASRFVNEKPYETIRILEAQEIFASGMLTPTTLERCKIDFLPADQISSNVDLYLQLIYNYEPRAIGGKLPDNTFLTGDQ